MRIHYILVTLLMSALLSLSVACDSSGGSGPVVRGGDETGVSPGDPGNDILPYHPPEDSTPVEDLDIGGGGGGGGGGGQQPVPEPSTLVLVGSGIAIIALCRKKMKKS